MKLSEKFKISFFKYGFVIFIALFLILLNEQYSNEYSIERLKANIGSLGLENQSFVTETNKDKVLISSQAQIILTQREAIDNGVIELDRIKKLKSKVSFVTNTTIDSIFVPSEEVLMGSEGVLVVNDNDVEERTFKFNYEDPNKWFTLKGFYNFKGLGIDNFTVKNHYTIYVADTKLNLFRKSVPEVILVNKNPYTETIEMNNIVITFDKPFYKRNVFWLGVGVVGGIIIAK